VHSSPKRLEQILARLLDRREERAKRRTVHIAELRKRGAEADARLKRLYDAIENGIAEPPNQASPEASQGRGEP